MYSFGDEFKISHSFAVLDRFPEEKKTFEKFSYKTIESEHHVAARAFVFYGKQMENIADLSDYLHLTIELAKKTKSNSESGIEKLHNSRLPSEFSMLLSS